MSSTADLIRIALLALLTGVALPLLVQLFLTLRTLQRVVTGLDQRLEQTLGDLSQVAATLRKGTDSPATAVLSAVAPAVVAAVHAFRSTMTAPASVDGVPSPAQISPTQETSK